MKKFEFIVAALALVAGVMFCSCVKDETDMLPLHDQHQIDFTASSDAEWLNATRADEEEEPQVMILEMEGDEDLEQPLYLHITCEDRKEPTAEELGMEATRGTMITTENFVQKFGTGGFGLFAYVYKGEWNDSRTSDYIHDQRVRYHDNTTKWHIHNYKESELNPSNYYYWPGKNYNIRFFAYAPYRAGYSGHILNIPANGNVYTGAPTIEFKLSDTNKNVFDFCIAKTDQFEGDCNQTVALNFKHALTAIDFVADAKMPAGTITHIKFFNIRSRDEIDLDKQEWKSKYSDSIRNVGFMPNKKVVLSGGKEQAITGDKDSTTYFLIPHTLREDAYFQVNFTPAAGGDTKFLKAQLSGVKWEMGKHYTYKISPKNKSVTYTFSIKKKEDPSSEDGPTFLSATGSDAYLGGQWSEWWITSYKTTTTTYNSVPTTTVEKDPVAWKAEFSVREKDGTWSDWSSEKPDMFLNFNTQGNHLQNILTLDAVKYGTNFAPITPDDPLNPFGANVESRPVNSGVTNLYSQNGNSSANCYVVNAAGEYIFPLVYGNAIKGAEANSDAYNGDIFVDHTGTKIDSPYIPDNYLNNAVAVLLWCDAPQLVTNVSLSTSTMDAAENPVRYIQFKVPKENLTPGNAVIALYDKDPKNNKDAVVIWSWHIWVTKWNPNTDFVQVSSNSKAFKFATETLGYCPTRKATWYYRSVKVRFRQDEPNGLVSSTYTFTQEGRTIENSEGNNVYYQWGRKDPLLPYNYTTNSDQTSTSGREKDCFFASHIDLTQIFDMYVWDSTQEKNVPQYDYSGYFGISNVAGTSSNIDIKTSIQNPHVFYARHKTEPKSDQTEYDWCNQGTLNRWDATNTSRSKTDVLTVKTIYDPSPAGWCVPPAGAFTSFTSVSGGYNKAANSNSAYPYGYDISPAFHFTIQGKNITFPITGDRNRYNGAPWWDTVDPRCVETWTSTPASLTKNGTTYYTCAYYVESTKSGTFSVGGLGQSSGFAIRCVKE